MTTSQLLTLRFIAIRQRVDAVALAAPLRCGVEAASMRVLRHHRQHLLTRSQERASGRKVYTLSPKGRAVMRKLAKR